MKSVNLRSDGQGPAPDLLLKGGSVLNVYSGELLEVDVAVCGERIWHVGPRSDLAGKRTIVMDVRDKVLVPGYVEPHCHPWDTYNPVTFGEEASRLGTTTLVCDNLAFYILLGLHGFEALMHALSDMPIRFFWFVRAVPQTPMEGEDELFSEANLERLLANPLVKSVGEITRWPELVRGNERILKVIRFAHGLGKRVDGHTAGAKWGALASVARAGVDSCHESISAQEVLDRVRLGFHVMLRHSSLRQDLRELLQAIREHPLAADRAMLTTDGSTPAFHQEFGVTDHLLRIAMDEGIDPAIAYRMVTLNPAAYFGLEGDVGAIAPGRYADILVLRDLEHPAPELVLSRGRVVAENGRLVERFPDLDWERLFSGAPPICHGPSSEHLYRIPVPDEANGTVRFPTIKLISTVITRTEWVDLPVREGFVDLTGQEGFCTVVTQSRSGRWIAQGVLQGFADRIDGIASSFNTAAEIVAIGQKPDAMAAAVDRLRLLGGGIVAIEDGEVAFELPLPLGGMMSERPIGELAEKDKELAHFLRARGYLYHDPLYPFIFLPNDFLPDVRINRKGVVDIRSGDILWPPTELRAMA